MSKRQDEHLLVNAGQYVAELAPFDIIKACEGYLASFEVRRPEEVSPSYLHGWRMGCLAQNSFQPQASYLSRT